MAKVRKKVSRVGMWQGRVAGESRIKINIGKKPVDRERLEGLLPGFHTREKYNIQTGER